MKEPGRVDWRQVRLIVGTALRMDLRGPRWGTEATRKVRHPFLMALATLSFMSIFLSTATLEQYGTFGYALVNLLYLMMVICSTVLGELHTMLLSPTDLEQIAARPVSSRTFFWAKLLHLGTYVGLMAAALGLWPGLFGGLLRHGFVFGGLYLVAASGAAAAAALACLAAYGTLVRSVSSERLKDILVYAQIILGLLPVVGYQMVASKVQALPLQPGSGVPAWAFAAPPAWFAAWTCLPAWPAGGLSWTQGLELAGLGALALLALAWVPVRTFSFGYIEFLVTQAAAAEPASAPVAGAGGWALRLARLWRHPVERASFLFAWSFSARDRGFKMRFYPWMSVFVLMSFAAMFFRERVDPLAADSIFTSAGFYAMATLYVPCLFLPMFLGSCCTTEQWKASWIFHLLGPSERVGLVRGVFGALVVRYLLPALGILWAVLAWWWHSPLHALIHVVSGLPVLYIGMGIGRLLTREFPFATEMEAGRQTSRIFVNLMLFYFLILPLAMGMGAAQLIAYRSGWIWAGFAVGALAFGAGIDAISRLRLGKVLGKLEFFG